MTGSQKMKINYAIRSPKCCATCGNRVRDQFFTLFCHEDKGPLDEDHLVTEIGICSEYKGNEGFGYREKNNVPKEKV
jgi:hypothetical protein